MLLQALKENIFMMVVCIMNMVPLIVVGKPGSSKTLAMMLIRDAFSRSTKVHRGGGPGCRSDHEYT